ARIRIDLERGRKLRSSGEAAASVPLFEAAFERALEARERDPENLPEIEIARYAVGKTLRLLNRPSEAAALLEHCIARSEPDPYFHEELSEIYAMLGRDEDAREQAELAARLR